MQPTQATTRRTTITPKTTQRPIATTTAQSISGPCRDPNGLNGICMNIKECSSILDELRRKQKDPTFIQYVQQSNSKCGSIQPFICCPNVGRIEEPNDQPSPSTSVDPTIQGRLLTEEEGCGFSNVTHKRIVGGNKAKEGKFIILICKA